KPLIAAVHGHCIGEGVNLVLACDMVIAEESSRFWVSEARVGVNAVDIPLGLARKMGYFRAFEMLMGLEGKSAAWCRDAGLVNTVVADGTAASHALALANRLASETAPLAIWAMKETLWRAVNEGEVSGREAGMRWREQIITSMDWAEGRAAFSDKRPPKFVGE
ncbi:MAG: enoyl-CoA hydratase, partial [Chloroflexi bacterium]|nr:enoyl-CoA hydratase [Chloroflexota bacterium]